jgi:hypothetical protein
MVLISIKMLSIANPSILNGKVTSQISGKKINSKRARGQHTTKRKHHRIAPINSFIVKGTCSKYLI